MLIIPESDGEHDLIAKRYRALQHVLGFIPITISPQNSYPLTLKRVGRDASDQTPAE